MTELTAGSLDEIVSMFGFGTTSRIRKWLYRGHGALGWSLRSSLQRGDEHGRYEAMGLRNFARYAASYLRFQDGWGLLVEAQHYGFPTRLLDWTFSPGVALHFATARAEKGAPVELLALDWLELHNSQGLPPMLFTVDGLNRAFPVKFEGNGPLEVEFKEFGEAVLVVEPPYFDLRVAAQLSALTLSSALEESVEDVIQRLEAPELLVRVTIPSECVARIRFELDLLGFDEQRLMPGLSGIAERMKRTYAPGHFS